MNILKYITNISLNKRNDTPSTKSIAQFNSIMSLANIILLSEYPLRINDLIYTLGKEKQFKRIKECITGEIDNNEDAGAENLFIAGDDYKYSFNKSIESQRDKERLEIEPSAFLVFTFPWNQNRIRDAFLQVGENVGDKWVHDPMNHQLTLVSPLNIGVITNGNHSAAMNIITNESSFTVTQVIDLSPVYEEIYTDGIDFKYKLNEQFIGKATSVEMAAIFEIGRLISTTLHRKI